MATMAAVQAAKWICWSEPKGRDWAVEWVSVVVATETKAKRGMVWWSDS